MRYINTITIVCYAVVISPNGDETKQHLSYTVSSPFLNSRAGQVSGGEEDRLGADEPRSQPQFHTAHATL